MFRTVSIPEILAAAPGMSGASTIGFLGHRFDTMTVLCILLFIGAMGKSAQLGLHTWLPDAMEGPTPVSALIHAATMVTAGVFMVCRLSPMFETAPAALTFVTFIGAATCFFAATIGTTQWDIKRVIAYSTCSQLGYMFFAAGVGAYGAAMFHLFTHAFFKALLFLGAGVGDPRDAPRAGHALLRRPAEEDPADLLGDDWRARWRSPASASPGRSASPGFYSKDAIIEAAYASGTEMGSFAFWMGVIAALLTSFYSWRLMFLTFWGKPRWIESEHIQHAVHGDHHDDPPRSTGHDARITSRSAHGDGTGGYHPHESPWTMLVPLGVLSLGAVFAGLRVLRPVHRRASEFWNGAIVYQRAPDPRDARHSRTGEVGADRSSCCSAL